MSNIQVVVRCRGRSDKELASKSPVVAEVPTEGGPTVTLYTSLSSTNSLNTMNSKTYAVDRAYGVQSDQQIIYKEVAVPLFKEFLSGFNVTVLAYGQTGTGKTYTMCGGGFEQEQLQEDAGIIPRMLVDLFESLEKDESDFIVKCSFLELYNEDLKDLLVDENSNSCNLRIYESKGKSSSQSIYVHGLKEMHVSNAQDALNLLWKGVSKRKTATTKMNDLSSRSHTIFTIILYKKIHGLDSFKVSKINLVDLAGSENISRSGAINQRAKEAGSINQSLLTLGRVINSLAMNSENKPSHNNHIPYRESKLTRLLQDSIGGETKTALIATISPAKVNTDETASTLEYASRAKNIQNKPQLGQDSEIFLKKTLLRDMSKEIAKLNNDLIAARQKNGIWLDEKNYKNLLVEHESLKTDLKESQQLNNSLNTKILHLQQQKMSNEQEIRELLIEKQDANSNLDSIVSRYKLLQDQVELKTIKISELEAKLNSMVSEKSKLIDNISHQLNTLDSVLLHFHESHIPADLKNLDSKLHTNSVDLQKHLASIKEGLLSGLQKDISKDFEYVSSASKSLGQKVGNFLEIQSSDIDGINAANNEMKEFLVSKCLNEESLNTYLESVMKEKITENISALNNQLNKNINQLVEDLNKKQVSLLRDSAKELSHEIAFSERKKIEKPLDKWNNEVNSKLKNQNQNLVELKSDITEYQSKTSEVFTNSNIHLNKNVQKQLQPSLDDINKKIQQHDEENRKLLSRIGEKISENTESQVVKLRNIQNEFSVSGEKSTIQERKRMKLSPIRSPVRSPDKMQMLKSKIPQLMKENLYRK